MSVPLARIDVEERTSERAEELAQKRFGVSFDVLASQLQMQVWTDAEVQVREELNEAAELAWEEHQLRESMNGDTPARCGRCGWEGMADELKPVYVPNPKEPGDVTSEAGCPECQFDGVDIG
jgi:predicted Zn-ribbon and HTH transcriptional regulator